MKANNPHDEALKNNQSQLMHLLKPEIKMAKELIGQFINLVETNIPTTRPIQNLSKPANEQFINLAETNVPTTKPIQNLSKPAKKVRNSIDLIHNALRHNEYHDVPKIIAPAHKELSSIKNSLKDSLTDATKSIVKLLNNIVDILKSIFSTISDAVNDALNAPNHASSVSDTRTMPGKISNENNDEEDDDEENLNLKDRRRNILFNKHSLDEPENSSPPPKRHKPT